MSKQRKQFRLRTMLIPLVIFTLLTNGCSSMQVMDTNSVSPLASVVEVGDQLRITTHENEIVRLVVESVDDESVSGGGQTVPVDEIQLVEVKRASPGRTLALVAVLTVTGLAGIASSGPLAPVTW